MASYQSEWRFTKVNGSQLDGPPRIEPDVYVVYVVVQFYPWFKFYFPLFLGMVIYDNEFKTKENKI